MLTPWNDPVILAAVDAARREGLRSVVAQLLAFLFVLAALLGGVVVLSAVVPMG